MRRDRKRATFPQNVERRKEWLKALQLENYEPKKSAAICSIHFKETDYELNYTNRKLKKDANPHLLEGEIQPAIQSNSDLQNITSIESDVNNKSDKSNEKVDEIQRNEIMDTCSYNTRIVIQSNSDLQNITSIESDVNNKSDKSNEKVDEIQRDEIMDTCPYNTRMVHRSTSISPDRIINSPTKNMIREVYTREIKAVKRKLSVTCYEHKRIQKKVLTLKNVLKDLQKRHLLTEEECDILQHLDAGTQELVKREIRKRKNLPVSRTYKPSLRQFALPLHFYSPKAYNYVRHKFYNMLPHPKTLAKWYHSFNGEPGINTEAIEAIKRRAHSESYKLIGALMFDEMAIRQHIDYCKDRFVGYVDYGVNVECDTTKIAKEALVFCVVCINQGWKLPIAYYLINGITTEQKQNLTLQCIMALHEAGMLVVSLTCDGLSTNLKMLQSLGCKFDIQSNNFQTWFKHPSTDTEINVFLDPCHMIKLVRNVLGTTKELLDNVGNKIQWKYFEDLHQLQEKEGLHLANKLRTKHIDCHKNKMKVKLASQLSSTSVANALELCRDSLQLPKFKDCSATIKYTSIFNDLFDILNSKSIKQHGFRKPINIDNYLEITEKLKESEEYIKTLVLVKEYKNRKTNKKVHVNVLNSKIKTGFLGFIININSLQHMYQFTCIDNDLLKYVPMYKISQDHLELLFSNIRSHNGYNNNPTVKQFKSIFKKLVIHIEIKDTLTGNCIPLENILILHVPSTQNSIDVINSTTNQDSCQNWLNVFHTTCTDHDYDDLHVEYPIFTTEYKNEVITYMAGYILRRLIKILHCSKCIETLMERSTDINCNLINIKNRGSLLYPSKTLVYVCKQIENTLSTYIHIHKTLDQFNMTRFTNNIMINFIDENIFSELKEHINNQDFLQTT